MSYIASGEGFFEILCCIDCDVEEYFALWKAEGVLEVESVYEKKLVDIEEGLL